ncbi:hypothetical protein AQI88_16635 [Streptomyces cellostaticus]|uniref:Uncharacterized protein n=1 Tax=Streptomyces cellostaticus TaxID=67285 RepID=A0A101NMQ3_9ACTN|nr:hypothetical protein [Streptomyces cellostaticus]KUM95687.1 hypothetical protein AQI88_16635 [Streptomyces cellostaticus]GHI09713.1 hypothetical protein Scel_80340 [Streptomyces cellostaticus]
MIVTAVCGTYITFYWADDPQVDDQSRAGVLWQGATAMAIPVLSMCMVLSRALRGRFGAPYWLLTALAAGSAAAWLTWAVSHRRPTVLYAIWLVTVAVVVVVTLAPQLHSAQTCGFESGAEGTPGGFAREYSW